MPVVAQRVPAPTVQACTQYYLEKGLLVLAGEYDPQGDPPYWAEAYFAPIAYRKDPWPSWAEYTGALYGAYLWPAVVRALTRGEG